MNLALGKPTQTFRAEKVGVSANRRGPFGSVQGYKDLTSGGDNSAMPTIMNTTGFTDINVNN